MDYVITTGVDIVEVERFENLERTSRTAKNTYTNRELSDCFQKANPAQSLAARFAAKEAVVKCIGNIRYNKIEIINKKDHRPKIRLLDKKLSKQYNLAISLSHTDQFAIAVCVACKNTLFNGKRY